MNPRERMLALTVLSIAVLAGGAYLFYTVFLAPLGEMDERLAKVQEEVKQNELRVQQIQAAKVRLALYKQLSLPKQIDYSRREYGNDLLDLLIDSGFPASATSVSPKSPEKSSVLTVDKKPVYTRLPFTVVTKGNLDNLVQMLECFYRKPLLHQIKSIQVSRAATTGAQAQQQVRSSSWTFI